MSDIKNMIRDQIAGPVSRQNRSVSAQAKVLEADEVNNLCRIEYLDKDGFSRNKNNVPVRIYGGSLSWFPKQGDLVVVEDANDIVVIVGKFVADYASEVASKQQATKDVYPTMFSNTAGGWII